MPHKWRLADYDKSQPDSFVEEDNYLVFVEDEIYRDETGNPIFISDYLIQSFYVRQRRNINEEKTDLTLQQLEKLTTGLERAVDFSKEVRQRRLELNLDYVVNKVFDAQLVGWLRIVIDTIQANKRLTGSSKREERLSDWNEDETADILSSFNQLYEVICRVEDAWESPNAFEQLRLLYSDFNDYMDYDYSNEREGMESELLQRVKDIPYLLGRAYRIRESYYYLTHGASNYRLYGGRYNFLSLSLINPLKFSEYVKNSWNEIYNMTQNFMNNYACISGSGTISIDFANDIDRLNNIKYEMYEKKRSHRCVGLVLVDNEVAHKEYIAFSGYIDTDDYAIVKKVIAPNNFQPKLDEEINKRKDILRVLEQVVKDDFPQCTWAKLTVKVGDYDKTGVCLNTLDGEIRLDPDKKKPNARYSCCERKCFVNVNDDWTKINTIKIYARFDTCDSCYGGIEELKKKYNLKDEDVGVFKNK